MEQGRILQDRLLWIDHDAEVSELDVDQFEGILGQVAVLREHCNDWLADVANLVPRQRVNRRRMVVFHARGRAHRRELV